MINGYLIASRDMNDERVISDDSFPIAKRITCMDGFSLSVQANCGAYCEPRTNNGPWYTVEVGFPSAEPDLIMDYAETREAPTETVYGYVPVELVEQLIEMHGGFKA